MLLLDLETTGLNPKKDTIVSIGLIYYLDENYALIHSFVATPKDERECLLQFLEFIHPFKMLLTYSGGRFELPFLITRCHYHQIDVTPLLKLNHVDLKHILKGFTKNRLELETLFYYSRHCHLAGLDIIKLYQTYQLYEEPLYKECILAHQKEELGSLLCFAEFYFALMNIQLWELLSQQIDNTSLYLTYKTSFSFKSSFYGIAYHITFSYTKETDKLHIILPLFYGTLYQPLRPIKDYYYIESQHQILHKSLAQFVPSQLKRKARLSECKLKKEGTFLAICPSFKTTLSIWYDDDEQCYIDYADFTQKFLSRYLLHLFYAK